MRAECPVKPAAQTLAVLRLNVAADADPAALLHVIERFRALNFLPRRVIAEFTTTDRLRIQVDASGLTPERMSVIAAKLSQLPCILTAHWYLV